MRTGFRALRLLQLFWPDPKPRLAFQEQVEKLGAPAEEGLDIHIKIKGCPCLSRNPLPYIRRTILEFAFPGHVPLPQFPMDSMSK